MITPRWFQLIKAHHDSYGIALTIPFLVGSLRGHQDTNEMSADTAKNHISTLLQSFQEETPTGCAVRLFLCGNLDDQPVATILALGEEFATDSLLRGACGGALALSAELVSHGTVSLAALTDQLFQHCGSAICKAHFSYQPTKHRYDYFTPTDIEFIACTSGQG